MVAILLLLSGLLVQVDEPPSSRWWDDKVEASLQRAPERTMQWKHLLETTRPEHRAGAAYLLTYMPISDILGGTTPEQLTSNLELAYKVRAEVPWGSNLPEEIFLDAVLPAVSVTEPRDSMRAEFHARYLPLVKNCKTPGEAALLINKTLFNDYKVRYNTRRLRTDQSSRESISQGMATCTGLTIMLVEACRAVGIPARMAGINSWPGRGGNHTWTEVWNDGWHYVGSAEPDGNGLDHAWFGGDAAKAIKDKPLNAIWAVSYRDTGAFFPLAWDDTPRINGENVTDRYTQGSAKAPDQPRLMVEVRQGGQRVQAQVTAIDRKTCSPRMSGKSLGPQADVNLHLSSPAMPGETFLVVARLGGVATSRFVTVDKVDKVVRIDLDHQSSDDSPAKLAALLDDRFGTDSAKRDDARKLLAEVPFNDQIRKLAWEAYKASPSHDALRKEFQAKTVRTQDRESPYLWRHVGEKPKEGWGLFIAMHGGGGVAQEVNDQQWHKMFDVYYKDHPEAGGYIYLALRAPNNVWNGFYDDAISPMVERLIRQFVLFADVNPDRVYAFGASHGGYGAFVIGPKIPYRFAAVHSSAAAPTPGETMGENLRDTRFTFMVGENDTDHGRIDRCREFSRQYETWRAKHGGYPGGFESIPGAGHKINEHDKDKTAEMLKAAPRNPWPKQVVWIQTDDVLKHFYWIEAPKAADHGRIEASVEGNTISIKTENQNDVALWLDTPLVDLARPVTVNLAGGASQTFTPNPIAETYCLGLEQEGDPRLAAPVRIKVSPAQ